MQTRKGQETSSSKNPTASNTNSNVDEDAMKEYLQSTGILVAWEKFLYYLLEKGPKQDIYETAAQQIEKFGGRWHRKHG